MRQSARARGFAMAATVAVFLGITAAPPPAAAATDPPTATRLVKKLVQEGVCTHLQVVDPTGHEVKCRTKVHLRLPIRVTAYSTQPRLKMALQLEIDDTCDVAGKFPSSAGPTSFDLVVGHTWFVTAEPILHKKIVKQIGGKVKTYTCPKSAPSSSPPGDSLPVD